MINRELDVFNDIAQALLADEEANPIAPVVPAKELHNEFSIELNEEPIPDSAFDKALKEIVLSTPKTSSKLFFNQLFGGRQPKAVLGELLSIMLNNSMYTYKVGGVQVGIEKEVINKSCELINYGDKCGGTFAAGGSMSNFMALLMARDRADQAAASAGVTRKMTLYTSKDSHYSIPKNASFAGIGRDQVRYIPSDEKGRMIPSKLNQAIQKDKEAGYQPFFINATAGTTVLGSFDPINQIANIAETHRIWLHVDGAYCGSVLFSEDYKHLIDGVNRADSFNYNAHKMLGVPLSCSVLLVKDKKDLLVSFSNDASYLYQTDAEQDDFNLGKTSLQCGRRNDALKLWTLWKSVGRKGLGDIVNHQFYLADITRAYVRSRPDKYELYSYDDSISICFNHKGVDPEELCTRLYEQNKLLVGFGSNKGETFVRFVTINANNTEQEIRTFFEVLEVEAEAILSETEVACVV